MDREKEECLINKDLSYKIQSNVIPKEQIDKQNELMKSILNSNKRYIGVRAPTGFGKTFVHLIYSLNKKPTAIFVPTRDGIYDYYNANNLIQYHKTNTGFLIGKATPYPITCPLFRDEDIDEKKTSHYDFCDLRRKNNDCVYSNNMFIDTERNRYTLKDEVELLIKEDYKKINSSKPTNLNELCTRVSKEWGWCPYYYLKEMVKKSDTKILDYQYFIINDLAKHIDIGTPKSTAIIDEFDILEKRLKERYETTISYQNIKNKIGKLSEKINRPGKKDSNAQSYVLDSLVSSILREFGAGLRKIGKKGSRIINFDVEFERNKHLKKALNEFNELADNANFKENVRHIKDEKKDIVHKVFVFLNSMNEINKFDEGVQTFIEYVEKTDDLYIKRVLISLKGFFEKKLYLYDKVIISSATLPHNEFLKKDFGNEIETFHIDHKIGKKRGIIYQSNDFDLKNKNLNKNFNGKTISIVNLIEKIPDNRIVIFYKSHTIFKSEERRKTLSKIFNERNIKHWIIKDYPYNKQKDIWSKFIKETQTQKGVVFCSSFGRYARGSNQLKDDNCRVIIIWGKPVEREPTYEKPLQYQIHEYFNDYFKKKNIPLDFKQFWYVLKPRKAIHQIVGRLTRSTEDYGFFVICSKENLENVLDKKTRSELDILKTTDDEEDVIDAMEDFFQGVDSINGRY